MVREEPDDLYSGYGREDVAPDLDTEGLQYDEGFQVSPREGIVVTGGLRYDEGFQVSPRDGILVTEGR